MKQITLTQGKVAQVSDFDFERLNQRQWSAHFSKGKWYAITNDGKFPFRKVLKMHREIMNPPAGLEVDHRDGDGLNNQRDNLRLCTHAQNVCNAGPSTKNTTGFKGVSRHGERFRATIKSNHNWMHIGVFNTPEEAARAYDAKAVELHGEFAWTNFEATS